MAEIKKLHVLLVSSSATLGGVETFAVDLVECLRDKVRFTVVLPIRAQLAAQLDHAGVEVIIAPLKVRNTANALGFFRLVRKLQPDVVHLNMGGALIRMLVRLAGRAAIITHVHGPPDPVDFLSNSGGQWKIARPSHRSYFCWSDTVIACSRWVANWLKAAGRQRQIEVITPGVRLPEPEEPRQRAALRAELGIPEPARVIAFLGRMVKQKGVDLCAAIFARVLEELPSAHSLVIGEGPEAPAFFALMSKFPGRVSLLGGRLDAASLLPAADLLLITSRWEPFGIVGLEAAVRGIPVVAFRRHGIPEAVKDGVSGILVAPDDVDAASATVSRVLADAELYDRLSRGGIGLSPQLDRSRTAADILSLYRRMVAG